MFGPRIEKKDPNDPAGDWNPDSLPRFWDPAQRAVGMTGKARLRRRNSFWLIFSCCLCVQDNAYYWSSLATRDKAVPAGCDVPVPKTTTITMTTTTTVTGSVTAPPC
jgi:hypothetical protein